MTEYAAIVGTGQYASTKNWQIRFNDPVAFKSSINKQVQIGDAIATLIEVVGDRKQSLHYACLLPRSLAAK